MTQKAMVPDWANMIALSTSFPQTCPEHSMYVINYRATTANKPAEIVVNGNRIYGIGAQAGATPNSVCTIPVAKDDIVSIGPTTTVLDAQRYKFKWV